MVAIKGNPFYERDVRYITLGRALEGIPAIGERQGKINRSCEGLDVNFD
jgi:hypothetical protein